MIKLLFAFLIIAFAMISPERSVSAQCQNSLDAEALDKLTIDLALSDIEWEAGKTAALNIYLMEGCHHSERVKTCVSWSISTEKGARIDEQFGVLSVDKEMSHNSVFTVK